MGKKIWIRFGRQVRQAAAVRICGSPRPRPARIVEPPLLAESSLTVPLSHSRSPIVNRDVDRFDSAGDGEIGLAFRRDGGGHGARGSLTAVVQSLHEAFMRAVREGDVAGAQALYADDVTAIWEYEGDEASGRAEIDELIAKAFENMTGLTVALKDVDAKALGEDHLASVGHWEVTYTGPDGNLVVLPLRSTEVLVRRNRRWQYVVQHVSAGLSKPSAPARGNGQ